MIALVAAMNAFVTALFGLDTEGWSLNIVLQNSTDYGAFSCYVDRSTAIWECGTQAYVAPMGQSIFGLLVGGTVILAMYIASDGDLVVPAVITTLFGGALVAMLPGGYQPIAIVIMFLGLVGAVFAVAVKYLAQGGY